MYHLEFDIDFKRNPYPGRYIVVEGIDGSGKTTQVERLKTRLEEKGMKVIENSEPNTFDEIGKLIREVLAAKVKIPPVAIQYLFSANRATTHQDIVIPALERGEYVVSHRCFWSAVAYGIVDRGGEDKESAGNQLLIAQSILSMYHQFIAPDFTFYLDIPVTEALERIDKMGKQKEIYEKEETLKKISDGYNWLLAKFPKEFTRIDGTKDVNEVTDEMMGYLEAGNDLRA